MADEVSISWQGMGEIIGAARDQATATGRASGFLCDAGLNDTGAFSGVLALFKGTYEDALSSVNEGMAQAMTGTDDLASLLTAIRDDLRASDEAVAALHTTIAEQVSCQAYVPGDGGPPQLPGIPQPVLDGAALSPQVTVPHTDGWRSPLGSPVDVLDEGTKLVEHGQDLGTALDDGREMDEFVDEHEGDDR